MTGRSRTIRRMILPALRFLNASLHRITSPAPRKPPRVLNRMSSISKIPNLPNSCAHSITRLSTRAAAMPFHRPRLFFSFSCQAAIIPSGTITSRLIRSPDSPAPSCPLSRRLAKGTSWTLYSLPACAPRKITAIMMPT